MSFNTALMKSLLVRPVGLTARAPARQQHLSRTSLRIRAEDAATPSEAPAPPPAPMDSYSVRIHLPCLRNLYEVFFQTVYLYLKSSH